MLAPIPIPVVPKKIDGEIDIEALSQLALSLAQTKHKTTASRLVRFRIELFCLVVCDEA